MTSAAAHAHLDRFNTAVVTGDWSAFLAALHPDAVMTFVGPPVGPFTGRAAIAEAYATNPPTDTMRAVSIRTDGPADIVHFAWSKGGTGTLTLLYRGDQIISLLIEFD